MAERNGAEDSLRDSELRFRSFIECSDEWFWEVDADGVFTYSSPRVRDLLGYEPHEVLGKTPFDLMPPDEAQRLAQVFGAHVRARKPLVALDNVNLHKNGSVVVLETNGAPMQDEQGQFRGYCGYDRDVTEARQSMVALRRSVSLLRASLESTTDGILVVDAQGKIVDYNKRFAQMWRIPEAVLSSHEDAKALEFVLDQLKDPDGFVAKVRELYGQPETDSFDVLEFKDDRVFERYSCPQRMNARPVGRVWSFRDVSKRRRAEEALAKEQYLMRALMENIPDGIYFKDTEGRFIRVNRASARRHGLKDPADSVGKTDFDFYAKEHAQRAYEIEQTIIRTGEPVVNLEEKETYTDRPPTWVSTTKAPLRDSAGQIVGTFGISRDITEHKLAEQERERLIGELQAALAEVKTLSGMLPICANCKKVRDDKGYWTQIEWYIQQRSDAQFSHGICPECMKTLYPGLKPAREDACG